MDQTVLRSANIYQWQEKLETCWQLQKALTR